MWEATYSRLDGKCPTFIADVSLRIDWKVLRYGVVANIIASHAIARGSIPRIRIFIYAVAYFSWKVQNILLYVFLARLRQPSLIFFWTISISCVRDGYHESRIRSSTSHAVESCTSFYNGAPLDDILSIRCSKTSSIDIGVILGAELRNR